jgi:hypothetical protein
MHNLYSVMRALKSGSARPYWERSGSLDEIRGMMSAGRLATLERMMRGEAVEVPCARQASLAEVAERDSAYYSYVLQAGYLAPARGGAAPASGRTATLAVPNREIEGAWQEFVLDKCYEDEDVHGEINGLFSLRGDPEAFAARLEEVMGFRLSAHDMAGWPEWGMEAAYHVFLLGYLSAFPEDGSPRSLPKSNLEAGQGRYDIRMERDGWNYLFELKRAAEGADLEEAARAALRQIEQREYAAGMDPATLLKVGVACERRKVRVIAERG